LLGEERSCHGTPGRRPADSARPRRHSSPTDEQ
jgi:hypothetical protein